MQQRGRRLYLLIIIFICVFLYCYLSTSAFNSTPEPDTFHKDSKPSKFPDNIFFLETSCKSLSEPQLSPRQACSIESAVRANPNLTVKVLFLCPRNESQLIFSLLKDCGVQSETIATEAYVNETPLQSWWRTGALRRSRYRILHSSDVLRMLTLWKYGGVYLDLDVVVTRALDRLGCNWAAWEYENAIGSAVLCFSKDRVGRAFTDPALVEIRNNFRGDVWNYNGPALISRVWQQVCLKKKQCEVKIYPSSHFYSIRYQDWNKYFTPEGMNEVKAAEKNAYGFHVWNKLSGNTNMTEGEIPYAYLAEKYCPSVYSVFKNNFTGTMH